MSKEDDFFDDFDVDLELGEDDNIEIDEHMNEDDLLMELDEMINQWNGKEREKKPLTDKKCYECSELIYGWQILAWDNKMIFSTEGEKSWIKFFEQHGRELIKNVTC